MWSQEIDRRLEVDSRQLRRECKVLLLGSDESGKNELVKQWKVLYQNGYTAEELALYRPTIYKNVIDCAKALISVMKQFEIQPEQELNRAYCEFLLDYSVDPDPNKPLGMKVGEAISSIWQDPCIPKILEHSSEFYIMDSAS
jgi:guanine nucleotide-binding protein subunit alpha